jgi:hypothetical protein
VQTRGADHEPLCRRRSLVLPSAESPSGGQKQEVTKVALKELAKEPAKFHGKLIQVEGVIQETQILKEKQGDYDYRLSVGKNNVLFVWCAGKLAVKKGDSVRINGEFRHNTAAASPFQVLVDSKSGKVEISAPRKPSHNDAGSSQVAVPATDPPLARGAASWAKARRQWKSSNPDRTSHDKLC